MFPWNSGGKLGDITGHSQALLSCSFKPQRPFRVVAAGEDFGVYFYKGPPFKYETHDKTHKRFVNSVRYAAGGEHYASAGSDKRMQLFDGKTGAKLRDIATGKKKSEEHSGSIYELSFCPTDSHLLMSASADRTCKLWQLAKADDADDAKDELLHTWRFARTGEAGVADMQVACLMLEDDYILSVSLSGHINYLSRDSEQPIKVVSGHQTTVTSLAVDRANGLVYSADANGRLLRVDGATGWADDMVGQPHGEATGVKFMETSMDDTLLLTVANDDRVVATSIGDKDANLLRFGVVVTSEPAAAAAAAADEEKKEDGGIEVSEKLGGSCRCFAAGNASLICAAGTHRNAVVLLQVADGAMSVLQTLELDYTPSAVAFSMDDSMMAVGGEDKCIYLYQKGADSTEFALFARICHSTFLTRKLVEVAFQPEGNYLASADGNRQIWIWDLDKIASAEDKGLESTDVFVPENNTRSFQFHSAIASSICWSPSGKQLASAGHDSQIIIWVAAGEASNDYIRLEHAFFESIRDLKWIDEERVVACSVDATVRFFKIAA